VARRLVADGVAVRAIVRRAGAAAESEPALAHARYEEIQGDFVEPAIAAKAAAGCDAVVHAAATSGPEMEPVRRVNVDGTRSMLDAARAAGIARFVQISTISVYDLAGHDVVDETAPLKSEAEPYGTTKAEADRIVLDAMGKGLGATIFRPGAILGMHPTSTWAVKVPERIRDRRIKLLRGGGNTMPFVHVEDLVDAVLAALRDDRASGHAYNVVSHTGTWKEYSDEVRGWFDTAPLDPIPDADAAKALYWTGTVSAARLQDDLGWKPTRTYADGMAEAAAHWANARQRKP
jgi:nucleoside-diphosphate-sugar epimerase